MPLATRIVATDYAGLKHSRVTVVKEVTFWEVNQTGIIKISGMALTALLEYLMLQRHRVINYF